MVVHYITIYVILLIAIVIYNTICLNDNKLKTLLLKLVYKIKMNFMILKPI